MKLRAAHLVRCGWKATIFLALLAGLTGGIAMATWAAGRRTATAFDRLVAFSRLPDNIVTVCPPDVTELDETALARCLAYEPTEEVATLRALPEIEAAGRGMFRPLTVAPADAPDQTEMAGGFFGGDIEMPDVSGRSILLEGRLYDTSARDEVIVNEYFRDRFGVAIGHELSLTFPSLEEIGTTATEGERFHGPAARVRVVGVVRSLRDLAARTGSTSSLLDEAVVLGGPGVWDATPGAAGYGGIVVRSRGDAVETNQAIEDALDGRLFNIAPANGADEIDPIREAISYEARGALALAVLAGLAVAVFGGQAVARQSRKEWADLNALHALGLSKRQAAAAAGLRGVVTGGLAGLVAVVTAAALSAVGTVGVARAAEVDPGIHLDLVVMIVGFGLVPAVVTMAAALPVGRQLRRQPRRRRELVVPPASLRPPLASGLGMPLNGGRGGRSLPLGTALASVALAAGAAVGGVVLTSSMANLTSTPEHFGAPWDLSFGGIVGEGRRSST